MLQDIGKSCQLAQPEREKSEACFWIAHNYWDQLKKLVRLKGFESEEDEIDFFRNTKPLFTAYIDYYVILSESLMFVPGERESELLFWNEEQKRYDRFVKKNKAFVDYYEQGRTNKDHLFFLRKYSIQENTQAISYDTNLEFYTGYDQLLGNYLALKKYLEYISCRKLLLQ